MKIKAILERAEIVLRGFLDQPVPNSCFSFATMWKTMQITALLHFCCAARSESQLTDDKFFSRVY